MTNDEREQALAVAQGLMLDLITSYAAIAKARGWFGRSALGALAEINADTSARVINAIFIDIDPDASSREAQLLRVLKGYAPHEAVAGDLAQRGAEIARAVADVARYMPEHASDCTLRQ